MSLVPIPSEQPETCAHCGAELSPDQRYCLSCGQPVSPVRLAFLDVLQTSRQPAAPAWSTQPGYDVIEAGYVPVAPQSGANAWLRRNSGLLSLLGVLVLCLIAGLLVGHWASQSKAPSGPQVIKVEGLSAAPAAAASTSPATATPPSPSAASEKGSAKEEAQAAKEAARETAAEKAPPPAPKKATTTIKKLSTTTGKKHAEEVNALGATPIETG